MTGQVEVKAETPKVERKCEKKLAYSHSQGELDAKKLKKPAEATPERAFLLREVDPTNILHIMLTRETRLVSIVLITGPILILASTTYRFC